jgi:hypothetical protein
MDVDGSDEIKSWLPASSNTMMLDPGDKASAVMEEAEAVMGTENMGALLSLVSGATEGMEEAATVSVIITGLGLTSLTLFNTEILSLSFELHENCQFLPLVSTSHVSWAFV